MSSLYGYTITFLGLFGLLFASDGHVFNAEKNVEYSLNKELTPGDVIRAWGVYKDDSTSKFSVNIRGSSQLYHLHVDFRPYNDVVVLNNYRDGSWKTEVRPGFSKNNFAANTMFEVKIVVLEDKYEIFFNGAKLSLDFPSREARGTANHVVLHGGSNGFQWTAMQLPNGPAPPVQSVAFPTTTGEKNYLESPLSVGDVITAWGVYATGSSKFSVNLMMENDAYFMIHVDFRPPPHENKVVLNSKKQNGWETELRTPLPTFVNGQAFKVEVKCLEGEFEIYHNGNVLGSRFPYRAGFALEDVKFVWLLGGSLGMIWTDLALTQSFNLETGERVVELISPSQSSKGWDGAAVRGIDGNTNGNYWSHSCTHTSGSKDNWWMANFAQNTAVSKVIIHNRIDCCSERINGAKVYVGDVFCGEVKYEVGKVIYEIDCGNAVGGNVKVVQNNQPLTLCEVQVVGAPSDETPLVNIAPGYPTWQSSEGWSGAPSRATDGRSSGNYWDGSCTHSGSTDYNMWKVDLIDKYEVNSVVIHNRVDCCSERINGVQVFVNNKLCGAVEYEAGRNVYVVDCADQVGSVIKITQEDNHLTLCEVEVLARVSDKESKLINVAGSGIVTQDSTGWDGVASRAVDGIIDGNYFDGESCSHNGDLVDGWWNLEFPEPTPIKKIIIYNRDDCCQDRIDGVKIYADDVYCGKISYVEGQRVYKKSCGSDTTEYTIATNIRIEAAEGTYLTLCEVQVLSDPNALSEDNLVNLAYNKPTSQSSTGWEGVSSRAVDGREAGRYSSGTCTHTSGPGWWKVDLQANYVVEKIWIRNRIDCCSERLDGALVYVGDVLCGTVEYNPLKYSYTLECGDGIIGNSVTIDNKLASLTLCEVKVYGDDTPVQVSAANWFATHPPTLFKDVGGVWKIGEEEVQCGTAGDVPVPADYFNEGQKRIAVWRPSNGNWYIKGSGLSNWGDTEGNIAIQCGTAGDIPVAGDYSGNGQISIAVWRPSNGNWYIKGPGTANWGDTTGNLAIQCGTNGDVPVPRDYFHEGKLRMAVWRPKNGKWYIKGQGMTNWGDTSGNIAIQCGTEGDIPVPGDYFGDGIVRIAVWRPSNGIWYIKGVGNADWGASTGNVEIQCGMAGDIPAPGDYFNEGKLRIAVFRPSNGVLYIKGNDMNSWGSSVGNVWVTQPETGYIGFVPANVWSETADRVVVGQISSTADDAQSWATCPKGYVVTHCEAQSGLVHSRCDGVFVMPDSPGRCVAVNGYQGPGAVARAVCSQYEQVEDPCNGPNILKYKNIHSRGPNPSVQCPPGYEQILCNARSPWRGKLTNKGVDEKGVIPNNQDCAVSDCTDRNWCEVTAVCRLIDDMEEYAAAVCSTCEGYHCGEGEECVMMDMDDDPSDAETPTCVERQTGCDDNDRCGDNGECIPVGSDGYECECEDGFEFSTVTGSCIPIHTIWRTVYGEPAVGDDAISYAECNRGEAVMRCHTFGAPSAADGVYIERGEDGIAKCIARASHRGQYPVVAIAYCGPYATFIDPCTQEPIHSVEYRQKSAHSPSISCPGGYFMESCMFHSPWTQDMNDAARALVSSIGSVDVDDDGSCYVDSCLKTETDRNFCKLTAICVKLTGDEYIKDACPTCEQVSCPDSRVCDLVNDLPLCLPRIPGGCETDNCGPGECIEDGANYTCACNSGFSFDGQTCVDVDECQELPCGNGECTNEAGSYSCDCMDGYYEDQGTCKDVNECLDEPCSDNERCSNIEGSYICDCLDTFIRDPASQACVCSDGFDVGSEGECVDIDECASEDSCGEHEVCFNTEGNFYCECEEGYEEGKDGKCKDFTPAECDVRPQKDDIKTMTGKKVQVKLVGEVKKTWKKYADIKWLKNNEPWDPKADGKEKFNGFTIRNFQAEDAAIYVGNIFIEKSKEENYKCSVTVSISLKEGSAQIDIEDRKKLASTQKVGKGMAIVCDVKLTNVDLENAGDPNNVNWYKVNQETGEDTKIEATDLVKINKAKGTYRLWFVSPQPEDSGTYKCEFNQQGVQASTDVSVVWG